MPRIPVRTQPYHTVPRCMRHYKSKRDLILRALGKASFINGSQFVVAWISPKGEVDVYASELLQSAVAGKDGSSTVLNRKELDREAVRIKGEMAKRWDEVRRLEAEGQAPVLEDDADDVAEVDAEDEGETEEIDPDQTLVDISEVDVKAPSSSQPMSSALKRPSPTTMMSTFSAATRSSTPAPSLHTLTLAPDAIENYYNARFAALQQNTCKLVVKNWIKVIEPKKQMKFPYNKGEELRPAWWPEGVRHREPDHLSKTERLTLLTTIVRCALAPVSRLELSTAEAAAFISRPRQSILREVYLVAKEEEKRRKEGDSTLDIVVHLPHLPVSPSAVSPDGIEKRSYAQVDTAQEKENALLSSSPHVLAMGPASYAAHAQKRMKHNARLSPLVTTPYDPNYGHPFTFAPQNLNLPSPSVAWRDSVSSAAHHLSPYPTEGWATSAPPSDYTRSPAMAQGEEHMASSSTKYHPNHLAPILSHHHHTGTTSPLDSPAYAPGSDMQHAYFPRTQAGHSYMQQQQVDYLQQQHQQHPQGYPDYGSPYLTDNWDGGFTQA